MKMVIILYVEMAGKQYIQRFSSYIVEFLTEYTQIFQGELSFSKTPNNSRLLSL